MKKIRGYTLLYGASGLMVFGFCVNLAVDYMQYRNSFNSAPFRLWIYVDALIWLLPAVLAFVAGYVAKKKITHNQKHP